jgi:hypothetical protein
MKVMRIRIPIRWYMHKNVGVEVVGSVAAASNNNLASR